MNLEGLNHVKDLIDTRDQAVLTAAKKHAAGAAAAAESEAKAYADKLSLNYGICSTSAATAEKEVACESFSLLTGAEVTVKFLTANTASFLTMNVNGTGAKPVYYKGAPLDTYIEWTEGTQPYMKQIIQANDTYSFRYNGSEYDLTGVIEQKQNIPDVPALSTNLGLRVPGYALDATMGAELADKDTELERKIAALETVVDNYLKYEFQIIDGNLCIVYED